MRVNEGLKGLNPLIKAGSFSFGSNGLGKSKS